jgi:ActR/RegA family two-component response regulator
MLTLSPDAEAPPIEVTPWVLLVVDDQRKRLSLLKAWENAGFGVEVASDAREALECLKVMTPSLVVVEDRLYRPRPR